MSRPNVLISSLGESPAVVTEAIDKLGEKNIQFDYVITLGTRSDKVRQSADLLNEHLPRHYGSRPAYRHQYLEHGENDEPITPEENIAYLKLVAQTLREYRSYSDVYVSLAGGRKTMSALVTLAVQIYGARSLCHVIHKHLDDELERKMRVEYLRSCTPEDQTLLLHPQPKDVALVRLPVVSLFPLRHEFIRALKGQEAERTAQRLLEESGLIEQTGGEWHATTAGEELGKILADIETLPPSPSLSPNEKEVVLHKHHGHAELKPHAERLRAFPYAQRIISTEFQSQFSRTRAFYTPHGRFLVETDPTQPDVLLVTLADASRGYRLKVFTTAQSAEQSERVKQALEQFLGK